MMQHITMHHKPLVAVLILISKLLHGISILHINDEEKLGGVPKNRLLKSTILKQENGKKYQT